MRQSIALFLILALTHSAPAGRGGGVKTLTAKKAGYYLAETKYPQLQGRRSKLVQLTNGEILRWAKSQQKQFIKDAEKEFKERGKPPTPYEYKADHKVTYYFSEHLISLRFVEHQYTGGARGSTQLVVFNFGRVGNENRGLTLSDLLREGAEYKRLVEDSLLAKLKRNEAAAWVVGGEVMNLTDEQLERFVIDPNGLTFLFNPYEVGPYVAGTFEVKLTVSELGSDFKKMLLLGRRE